MSNIYKYGKEIVWSLPLLFQYEPVWATFKNIFNHFEIELPQINGFGCPACAWAGGRSPAVYDEMNGKTLRRVFEYLKKLDVTPSFTFTCTTIPKEDFKNPYANYILDLAAEYDSHFIIYDDDLKDYIKNRHPNAYTVASVIKASLEFQGPTRKQNPTAEKETEFYNKLLKEYDLVVVRPEYSRSTLATNPKLIDDISRVEVLINQPCIYECPKMPDHYRYLEKYRFGIPNEDFKCARVGMPPKLALENTMIHSEELTKKLVQHGVRHLKIQGRGVGTLMNAHMLMLYNQMFRSDGNNYIIYSDFLTNVLEKEAEYFTKEVWKENSAQ
ncbi:MAG: hypothetical protein IJW73_02050 [Candidatus Gastranaerophilales bacterium]|nr:hypothetical protein [Candidatus Gastranaerophilales bacterium]